MCNIFQVPKENFSKGNRESIREIDFCLTNRAGKLKRCEVKLMGKGNPEGADSLYARKADVFVASKLSDTNIQQLNGEGVEWVELNKPYGFLKFEDVLRNLDVPYKKPNADNDSQLQFLIKNAVDELDIE